MVSDLSPGYWEIIVGYILYYIWVPLVSFGITFEISTPFWAGTNRVWRVTLLYPILFYCTKIH